MCFRGERKKERERERQRQRETEKAMSERMSPFDVFGGCNEWNVFWYFSIYQMELIIR